MTSPRSAGSNPTPSLCAREKEFRNAIFFFDDETTKLARLKTIEMIPVTAKIVTEAWNILLNYHLYQNDALQMASCVDKKGDVLLAQTKNSLKHAGKQSARFMRWHKKLRSPSLKYLLTVLSRLKDVTRPQSHTVLCHRKKNVSVREKCPQSHPKGTIEKSRPKRKKK